MIGPGMVMPLVSACLHHQKPSGAAACRLLVPDKMALQFGHLKPERGLPHLRHGLEELDLAEELTVDGGRDRKVHYPYDMAI